MRAAVFARPGVLPGLLRFRNQRVDQTAKGLGYTAPCFSLWINSLRPTPWADALRIANAVGWPINELFLVNEDQAEHPVVRQVREAAVVSEPLEPDVADEVIALVRARTASAA